MKINTNTLPYFLQVAGLVDSHSAAEIAHVLSDLMQILQGLPEGEM